MLAILVLLHCYNQLNGYCDISMDDYRSTKYQYGRSLLPTLNTDIVK